MVLSLLASTTRREFFVACCNDEILKLLLRDKQLIVGSHLFAKVGLRECNGRQYQVVEPHPIAQVDTADGTCTLTQSLLGQASHQPRSAEAFRDAPTPQIAMPVCTDASDLPSILRLYQFPQSVTCPLECASACVSTCSGAPCGLSREL
jgi:hypothetical protein